MRYPLLLLALLAACSDAPTETEIASWVWVLLTALDVPCGLVTAEVAEPDFGW